MAKALATFLLLISISQGAIGANQKAFGENFAEGVTAYKNGDRTAAKLFFTLALPNADEFSLDWSDALCWRFRVDGYDDISNRADRKNYVFAIFRTYLQNKGVMRRSCVEAYDKLKITKIDIRNAMIDYGGYERPVAEQISEKFDEAMLSFVKQLTEPQKRSLPATAQRADAARVEADKSPKTFRDCSDCPEMIIVPAGSFQMGSGDTEVDNKPLHTVRIGKSFALSKTEVTQGQWKAVMGSSPSNFSSCGVDCPVENVSWNDAMDFIRKLNQKTGNQYRLPSEAEWEYACRAGSRHEYCGNDNVDDVAWHHGNSGGKTHSVAGKQANAWGLYDMSGNVWEWTADCLNGSYGGAPTDGSAWLSGDCKRRVLRGGSWLDNPPGARAAYRASSTPEIRANAYGLRIARMLP